MELKRVIDWESKTAPGVRARIRVLSLIARGRRDREIAGARAEIARLYVEQDAAVKRLFGDMPVEQRQAKFDSLPVADQVAMTAIANQIRTIELTDVAPVVIRAGVVDIDGVDVEGVPATVEDVVESCGNDELLLELFRACEDAARLTAEQAKN